MSTSIYETSTPTVPHGSDQWPHLLRLCETSVTKKTNARASLSIFSQFSLNQVTKRKWHQLFTGKDVSRKYLEGEALEPHELDQINTLIESWRSRLFDISWFMKVQALLDEIP